MEAARLHPMVRHVKDRDSGRPRRIDDLAEIFEGAHLFGDVLDQGEEFASFAHEIVVKIDAKDGGNVWFIGWHFTILELTFNRSQNRRADSTRLFERRYCVSGAKCPNLNRIGCVKRS